MPGRGPVGRERGLRSGGLDCAVFGSGDAGVTGARATRAPLCRPAAWARRRAAAGPAAPHPAGRPRFRRVAACPQAGRRRRPAACAAANSMRPRLSKPRSRSARWTAAPAAVAGRPRAVRAMWPRRWRSRAGQQHPPTWASRKIALSSKDLPMRPSSGSCRHEPKRARPMRTPGQGPETRCWSVFADHQLGDLNTESFPRSASPLTCINCLSVQARICRREARSLPWCGQRRVCLILPAPRRASMRRRLGREGSR